MISLEEFVKILELKRAGLTVSAIAERTGLDRKTVRKYLREGSGLPAYKPRERVAGLVAPYEDYLRGRLSEWPRLSGARLLREIRELGYRGGKTILNGFLCSVRPSAPKHFEVRFETGPGEQAQVDFAEFKVQFGDGTQPWTKVWLFSMVLGHSRYLWARYVMHQDLPTVLRSHMDAFEHFGGVPGEILYDRMKTAVLGERQDEMGIVYNAKLLSMATHYGFTPRACKPYRAKTKGKVERPFRYIRQDFFMGRRFMDVEDMNRQLVHWLDTVANVRCHGTTSRIISEHFKEEQPRLGGLPAGRFEAVLRVERRVTRDGMVSIGGNFYSVPDGTAHMVHVESTPDEVRVLQGDRLVAVHDLLMGRNQRSLLDGHRRSANRKKVRQAMLEHEVARRPLQIYELIGQRLGGAR
jgi:transposase